MKAADYLPDARIELIESALFYEARQTHLGSKFLIAVEACQNVVQRQPALGAQGLTSHFKIIRVYPMARNQTVFSQALTLAQADSKDKRY